MIMGCLIVVLVMGFLAFLLSSTVQSLAVDPAHMRMAGLLGPAEQYEVSTCC
jgi:1,4-dihydroxy-2-naphthoate octaprenyltransferase